MPTSPGSGAPMDAARWPASFEGELLEDDASLTAAARDFGRIVDRRPRAVLRPGSVNDVVEVIRFARARGIPVAARGQGHNTFGQAQVEGGVVLDMSSLARIREISRDSVLVEGGARWSAVVDQAAALGVTPPALTDYLELSVGGTLSVGGVGGTTFRYGTQTDNVLGLEVVTGAGDLVRCSPERDADLFDACRAGLGQAGVIVAARVRLIAAPPRVRVYTMRYGGVAPLLADQLRLAEDDRFDYLDGTIVAEGAGRHAFVLSAAKQHAPGDEPDDARLLEGLACLPGTTVEDTTYLDFARRVERYIALQKRLGAYDAPHPWLDLFLPATRAERFLDAALDEIGELRDGMILTYVLRRSRCRTPFLPLPDEEHVLLFDLLRNAFPATPERVASLLQANARLYREALAIGGRMYPIGSIPLSPRDWEQHFQPGWDRFAVLKRRFDPAGILTPGQGIFASDRG